MLVERIAVQFNSDTSCEDHVMNSKWIQKR